MDTAGEHKDKKTGDSVGVITNIRAVNDCI